MISPGPWRVQRALVVASDGRIVADTDPRFDRPSREQREANAALIATAPDLLAEKERLQDLLAEACEALTAVAVEHMNRRIVLPIEIHGLVENARAKGGTR